jgi:ADP-ribose pyrophosphatase YjhB (NUDIX family)
LIDLTGKIWADSGKLVSQLITFGAVFQRPMTLGVRGLVIDRDNRILLVRHSYVPGFYLPGGGVEYGETLLESLTRELEEEGNIVLDAPPLLYGMYLNRRISKRDHVALFIVRDFTQTAPRIADREIVEAEFFGADALPPDATPATRARVAEVLGAAPVSPYW